MLKPLKRLLAASIAALSVQPATRAAIAPTERVATDEDIQKIYEAVEVDDNYVAVSMVRPEILAKYDGPITPLTGDLLAQVRAAKKWRNSCITAREEFNEFVEARTR